MTRARDLANLIGSGNYTTETLTATAGQTVFTPSNSYTPNFIQIYMNGLLLDDTVDYTATNGTTITLTVAASAGDEMEVVTYNTFSVGDAITQTEADGRYVNVTGGSINGNFSVDGGTIKLDGNYPVGTGNVALGDEALSSGSLSGNYNSALGSSALVSNTTGANNTALGFASSILNTTGSQNTAVGTSALYNNTTASFNTAVGYQAGYSNTTGTGNTLLGNLVGYSLTTGTQNTFVGGGSNAAGYYVTTGSKNTILGQYNGNQGGLDIRTSSNNIVLSDGDGNPRVHVNSNGDVEMPHYVLVGGNSGARFYKGTSGRDILELDSTNTGSVGLIHFYNPNGFIAAITTSGTSVQYNTTSDYRLKENVVEMTGATERLKQIPVYRFNFKNDPAETLDGFLAHEVQEIVPEAVTGEKDAIGSDGTPRWQGIDQSKLVPLLVATIKELEARITALEAK